MPQYTYRVPVSPAVAKYFAATTEQPILLSKDVNAHKMVYSSLQSFAHLDTQKKRSTAQAYVEFALSPHLVKCHRFFMKAKHEQMIATELKRMMYAAFCAYMNGRGDASIYDRILEFMDLYSFTEEDMPFDTLKKYYYRYRRKFKQVELWTR